MTRDEFKELLIRLNVHNKVAIENPGASLPLLTMFTAAHCFTHDIDFDTPEKLKDIQALRDQCLSLETKGYFIFEGE